LLGTLWLIVGATIVIFHEEMRVKIDIAFLTYGLEGISEHRVPNIIVRKFESVS
jgi:hypothetical protein